MVRQKITLLKILEVVQQVGFLKVLFVAGTYSGESESPIPVQSEPSVSCRLCQSEE